MAGFSNLQAGELVLVIEPDATIRQSLLAWLRSAMPECPAAGAANPEEALLLPQSKRPSVVVVDVAEPGMDGAATIRSIKSAMHCAHVVALTMSDDPKYCDSLASAGASASLLIWRTSCELPVTIRRLLAGDGHREGGRH